MTGLAEHMRLAATFARWIDESKDFERLAPAPLSVVCFRAKPAARTLTDTQLDQLNARILESVNASGDVFLSHTKIDGCFTLRLAVGHIRTREEHVARAWELLREALAGV